MLRYLKINNRDVLGVDAGLPVSPTSRGSKKKKKCDALYSQRSGAAAGQRPLSGYRYRHSTRSELAPAVAGRAIMHGRCLV
jgi:hypothetical protein